MSFEMLMSKARPALIDATQLDSMGSIDQALEKYKEGIGYLMEALPCKFLFRFIMVLVEDDPDKQNELRKRITSYLSRAETLKSKSSVPIKVEFDQLRIAENSKGNTYERIFSRCIDDRLTEVVIEDPYISAMHQVRLS